MVEECGIAGWTDINAYAGTNHHGFRMINYNMLAADEADRKRAKRLLLLICLQRFVEVLDGHAWFLPFADETSSFLGRMLRLEPLYESRVFRRGHAKLRYFQHARHVAADERQGIEP